MAIIDLLNWKWNNPLEGLPILSSGIGSLLSMSSAVVEVRSKLKV
jgi:hypothetical protein